MMKPFTGPPQSPCYTDLCFAASLSYMLMTTASTGPCHQGEPLEHAAECPPRVLCSISKLYVQDACINRRDNELGMGSVELPACSAVHDNSDQTCESVFADGEPASSEVPYMLLRMMQKPISMHKEAHTSLKGACKAGALIGAAVCASQVHDFVSTSRCRLPWEPPQHQADTYPAQEFALRQLVVQVPRMRC